MLGGAGKRGGGGMGACKFRIGFGGGGGASKFCIGFGGGGGHVNSAYVEKSP